MNYTCAVCGRPLEADTDHVKVNRTTVWIDAPDEMDAFMLHFRCAERVMGSWEKPALPTR